MSPRPNRRPTQATPPAQISSFPSAWQWLVDDTIPEWVKQNYSPRESWKGKPFSKDDARFFFKGIEELSEIFTEDRSKKIFSYFQHAKYRSAYLLYFLPLQAAKFVTLFHLFPKAIDAAVAHGKKKGVMRVLDLGSGPGTASLSLLLALLESKNADLPPIELHWFDLNSDIMADGKGLVELLADSFPRLRNKVQIKTHTAPWQKTFSEFKEEASLVFMGNVINESSVPQNQNDPFWNQLLEVAQGGGILFLEPAARHPAQMLSTLRDRFFELEWIEKSPQRIWGPCLHAEACPLAEGRDWCHFSVPTRIPGKWFKGFSEGLGSERLWVKFSYLWVASAEYPAPKPQASLRRVISDPLSKGGPKSSVLICEPEVPGRFPITAKDRVFRGDLVKVSHSARQVKRPPREEDEPSDF